MNTLWKYKLWIGGAFCLVIIGLVVGAVRPKRVSGAQPGASPDVEVVQVEQKDVPSIRIEADLVDQLFNSSEKRLARALLLIAHYGKKGEPQTALPPISQETLAEMIGTTRARVNFFMNRFRKLGFIEYNGGLKIHNSLLSVVLHD
jgi:hypothetical protein